MPPVLHEPTWRAQFDRLWRLRFTWQSTNVSAAAALAAGVDDEDVLARRNGAYNITVVARMCPSRPLSHSTEGGADAPNGSPVVTVPLHQRLQMIKRAKRCDTSEALRVVFAPTASGKPYDPFAGADLCVESAGDDVDGDAASGKENAGVGGNPKADNGTRAGDAAAAGVPPASGVLSLRPGVLTVSPTSVTMVTPRRGVRE